MDNEQWKQEIEFIMDEQQLDMDALEWLDVERNGETPEQQEYGEQPQYLVGLVSEFVDVYKQEIAQAIVDGKISLEGILDAIGLEYDTSSLTKAEQTTIDLSDYDYRSDEIESHDER
jgi:hypothetical protein